METPAEQSLEPFSGIADEKQPTQTSGHVTSHTLPSSYSGQNASASASISPILPPAEQPSAPSTPSPQNPALIPPTGQLSPPVVFYSSASESESQSPPRIKGQRRKKTADESVSPPETPRARKPARRRSKTVSEAPSERSFKSEYPQGGGYTSTPATGKIFRNLLILEESLRQQVIQQRTLRRKYLTFLAALCSLIASISYHLYFAETSRGPLRVCLQLILLMLVVTLLLYHLSGEYQKTIVLPRRFLASTNKGLRQLNVRLVKSKASFTGRTVDLSRELGLFFCIVGLNVCHSVSPSMVRNAHSRLEVWLVSVQSRCQPRVGLNDIKLVLAPRSFNTDIREGWELYRDEFWIKEGIRRRDYLLDFTRGSDTEKRGVKREKKDKRRRKSSVLQRPVLSEHNLETLETLDSMSVEGTPQAEVDT